VIDTMQTRDELYQAINYYDYEKALDQTLGKDNG
jgi:2-methylisocitrate lyase-like PEP mutase family enzyme